MKKATIAASAILFAATCVFAQQENTPVQQTTIQQTTVQQTTVQQTTVQQTTAQQTTVQQTTAKQTAATPQDTVSEIDKTTAEQPARKVRNATAGLGIRGDYNFADYWGTDNLNGADGEASGWGFNVGVIARFEIIDVLWFTPELHFEYFKLSQDYDEINIQLKQSNLVLPLLFRAVLHPRAYFEVGPQLSLNLSNDLKYDAEKGELHVSGLDQTFRRPTDFNDNIEQSTFAFGVAMGLGFYIIPDRLSINARIYVGLTDLYPDATSVMLYEGDIMKQKEGDKIKTEDCKVMEGTKLRAIKLGLSLWFI
ncbi:porin family protein [uncultured Fibrobacter sp.]|uniref:porin family protein n=1 Tax=uncultured Fibrobacter sp. TaxID=261512 RepID=UPI0025DC7973|nr:porin family protein [uncultured Fibrobacter sp.]